MREKYRNNEEVRSRSKQYKLAWYHTNKEKQQQKTAKQREANPMLFQYRGIRARAAKCGVPFGFDSFEHFISVVDMPDKCPVLGIQLDYRCRDYDKAAKAHIDRVVPSSGYVPGNVKIISAKANQLKQDNNVDTLQALLNYMKDTAL